MASTKQVELYFCKDHDNGGVLVSNVMPITDGESVHFSEDATSVSLCEKGLAVFGLTLDMFDDTKVVRLRLDVASVEAGELTVTATFKDLRPAPRRRRKRAK